MHLAAGEELDHECLLGNRCIENFVHLLMRHVMVIA
jgi:hypothetical protein